jgi:predicted ATPase
VDETIIGRDHELAELDAAFDHQSRWATAAILVGPAGAGKTTLWRAAVDGAWRRGRRVLEASPARAEARLSYAALGDLLSSLDDTEWASLPGPQRRAFDIALLRADPGGQAAEVRAIAVGMVTLLRSLVLAHGPLVVAIDDAQWLDGPSSATIAYALRRLTDVPIMVLCPDNGPRLDPGQPRGCTARPR